MTQNNLGVALKESGKILAGAEKNRVLEQAKTALENALLERSKAHFPLQWAQTHNNLAQVQLELGQFQAAADGFANVVLVYPRYRAASSSAQWLYHEVLFDYAKAHDLAAGLLAHYPEDLGLRCELAEKQFTSGRQKECASQLAVLGKADLGPNYRGVLAGIEIANLIAQGQVEAAPARLADLIGLVEAQAEDFQVGWRFTGTKRYIASQALLAGHAEWLRRLFDSLELETRDQILAELLALQQEWPSPE